MLYSPSRCEVVSVLVGVAVGVVTDCDSLSVETTLTIHIIIIDISRDLNTHHTTPQLKDIHQTCTACVHARNCVTALTLPPTCTYTYPWYQTSTHNDKQPSPQQKQWYDNYGTQLEYY